MYVYISMMYTCISSVLVHVTLGVRVSIELLMLKILQARGKVTHTLGVYAMEMSFNKPWISTMTTPLVL